MMIISVSFQRIKQIIMIRGEEISVFESLGKVAATICKLQPLSLICCMTRTTPYPGDIQNYSATLFITNFYIFRPYNIYHSLSVTMNFPLSCTNICNIESHKLTFALPVSNQILLHHSGFRI